MYVFPGIGLAASVAGVTKITDRMLYRAAVACTDSMNAEEIAEGRTFPCVPRIREVAHAVAFLASDLSSYTSGEGFRIDAGFTGSLKVTPD